MGNIRDEIEGAIHFHGDRDGATAEQVADDILSILREPTPAMIKAGSQELIFDPELNREEMAADIWRAMINAAFNETPEE